MKSVSRPKFKRVISVEELKSKRTPRTAKRKPEKKQSKRANVFSSLGKRSDISLADVMSLAKLHQSQQVGYECKTVSVEGKIDVSVLYADYGTVWKYLPSPVSSSVQSVVMNLFKGRQYRFNLSTCFNMSSSGTGIINSAINVAALASNPSFTALSGVFSEFFCYSHGCALAACFSLQWSNWYRHCYNGFLSSYWFGFSAAWYCSVYQPIQYD